MIYGGVRSETRKLMTKVEIRVIGFEISDEAPPEQWKIVKYFIRRKLTGESAYPCTPI